MIYLPRAQAISVFFCAVLLGMMAVTPAHAVFINEIHYDNAGADTGEGVELSGAAGVDLAGWSLVLYNGGNSSPYGTDIALHGVFAESQNGMGVLDFGISGLQNGGADGIALVDNLGDVVQFLSYEGAFTATAGIAAGMTSSDIGVAESSSTLAGYSLQLIGAGRDYADFSWAASPVESSFGDINRGQVFAAAVAAPQQQPSAVAVPAPSGLSLFLLGLCACLRMTTRSGLGSRGEKGLQAGPLAMSA